MGRRTRIGALLTGILIAGMTIGIQGAYGARGRADAAPSLPQPVSVDAGYRRACAVVVTGQVYCWGVSGYGTLSNGQKKTSVPLEVPGIDDAVEVSTGYQFTCARLETGDVACWGKGGVGQLGGGHRENSTEPVVVNGIDSAVSITAGRYGACAVVASGQVYCWGYGPEGALGDGHKEPKYAALSPVPVSGISEAISVASSGEGSCALLSSGRVECWGDGSLGQLGDGSTASSAVPVPVDRLGDATQLVAGESESCAIEDGFVDCWGSGAENWGDSPVEVGGVERAVQVDTSGHQACAVVEGGEVECWGSGQYGDLGDESYESSLTPVLVSGLTPAVDVSTGQSFGCALLETGQIRCWGEGAYGQLGSGTFFRKPTYGSLDPVTVEGF